MTGFVKTDSFSFFFAVLVCVNAAVLLGAYGFEIIGGLAPCQLCYYQRIPYFVAVSLSVTGWFRPGLGRYICVFLALNFFAGAALGGYHAGVEWKFWPGPASCSVMNGANIPVDELMAQLLKAPVVRCDEIPWSLFGLSLAGYNMLISTGLMALSSYGFYHKWKENARVG